MNNPPSTDINWTSKASVKVVQDTDLRGFLTNNLLASTWIPKRELN